MRLRSLLFVPADRPERIGKALAAGADAVILDLEDSVAPERKSFAREVAAGILARQDLPVPILVRVNPIGGALAHDDLAMLAAARHPPDGIVLPKSAGAHSIRALAAALGNPPILPIATETPAAIFALGSYAEVSDRLLGLTWGAEDLSAAVGAATAREPDGRFTPPYDIARSLALFAAAAAGVAAIETVYPDFRDLESLRAFAARAARDGFAGMMAIHPSQVRPINEAFTPSDGAIAEARRIIAAFEAAPAAGALAIDGRMIDAPHLAQARRLLARLTPPR